MDSPSSSLRGYQLAAADSIMSGFGEFRRQFIANYVPTEKVRADRLAHQANKAKLTSPSPMPETAQE